jgi:hypothetical protein
MEPFLIIVVPGLLGGILLAFLFARLHSRPDASNDERLEPASTNLINMARIRVAGMGGLGMVAMSIVVAIFVPRIRLTMAIALVLGAALAGGLIALRRRLGPWSDGQHPGAHSMLPNDNSDGEVVDARARICRPPTEKLALPARL